MVGEPAFVSLYLKLPSLRPDAIATLVMLVVSPVSRNTPPVDVVERSTWSGPFEAGLPN